MGISIDWYEQSLKRIEDGKLGLNTGFPFRLGGDLSKHLSIVPGKYYLIGALSNVGKSSFLYDQFLFNMHDKATTGNFNVHIDIYTPEISPAVIIVKAMCYWLFTRKGILTTPKLLMSEGALTIPSHIEELIMSKECVDYTTALVNRISFYTYITISNLKRNTFNYLKTNGKLTIEDRQIVKYEPHNQKDVYMVAIDHIGIASSIGGANKKQTIDDISKFLFTVRNPTKLIAIVVQQITPTKDYTPEQRVLPGHTDLRDSKSTYEDADIMIGIGSPYREGIALYGGYKIIPRSAADSDGLKGRFRVINIMKNRDGDINILTPTFFFGEIGYFGYIGKESVVDYKKISEKVAITK